MSSYSSSSSTPSKKQSFAFKNKYVFTCPVTELEKIEPFFQQHLNYIQYEVKKTRIEGFFIRTGTTTKTKMLDFGINNLIATVYKDDPFKMLRTRQRSQNMIILGEFPSKHTKPLDKKEEVRTRCSTKQSRLVREDNERYNSEEKKKKEKKEKDKWIYKFLKGQGDIEVKRNIAGAEVVPQYDHEKWYFYEKYFE